MKRLISFWVMLLTLWVPAVQAESRNVQVQLVADSTHMTPGVPFWVGVRCVMPEGTHIYWTHPGSTGLPTEIEWQMPEGLVVADTQWPLPERFESSSGVTYGYAKEVLIRAQIIPSEHLKEGMLPIRAHVQWLACNDTCVPGEATLDLTLPVTHAPPQPSAWKTAFEETKTTTWVRETPWLAKAIREDDTLLLKLYARDADRPLLYDLYFYPLDDTTQPQSIQTLYKDDSAYVLRLPIADAEHPLTTLRGVLYNPVPWQGTAHGWLIDLPVQTTVLTPIAPLLSDVTVSTPTMPKPEVEVQVHTYWAILALAFIGGILLNAMPCVFPVLGLKVMSWVQQSSEDPSKAKAIRHALMFLVGVMVSFWALAGTLWVLRSSGQGVGWGFQLQSPGFVLFLIVLFFVMGLSLLGVMELGSSLIGLGNLGRGNGSLAAFTSGILATVVATPCTGPFMGVAIGVALTQSFWESMGVFTALGVGLALPYCLLVANPWLARYLPKPGMWMDVLKNVMAFPMLATVIWLVWVLGQQTSFGTAVQVWAMLLIIGLGIWIYGRFANVSASASTRRIAQVLSSVIILLGIWQGSQSLKMAPEVDTWVPFSQAVLDQHLAQGRPVFVDFTAAWCLTCQANKVVLNQPSVQQAFTRANVVRMEANWTKKDAVITQALASLGRTGVPVYALYVPGHVEPVILPTVLTEDTLLSALKQLP